MAATTNNSSPLLPELRFIEDPLDIGLEDAQLLGADLPDSPHQRPIGDAHDRPTIMPSPSAEDAQSNGFEGYEATQKPPSWQPPPVKWGIGWRFPILLVSFFITGTLAAMGHHIYYQGLENTPVQSSSQQIWAIRIGSGLAFLSKTCLAAVMSMIATQQIWFTVRRRFITLRGIDSMFKLMSDPTAILNRDLLTWAKTLALLASLSWAIPFIAVVTPATLSVRTSMESSIIPTVVPTVNYSSYSHWLTNVNYSWGATADVSRLFAATYSSVSYSPTAAPFPNSSYELSFWAPTYKCSSFDDFLAQQNSPPKWDFSKPGPPSYQAAWDEQIQPRRRMDAYVAVVPRQKQNMMFIWAAGISSRTDNSSNEIKIACQLYNTSYEVSVRFDNGVQSILPLSISHLHPQDWDEKFNVDPFYNNGEITITSWATNILFNDLLKGNITIGFTANLQATVPLLQSGLVSCPEIWNSTLFQESTLFRETSAFGNCRNQSLAEAIEDLSRNFTYSLMTFQQGNYLLNTTVPVTVTAARNLYSYDKTTLLATYAASILVVLLWIGIGGIALWSNGTVSSTSFSTILLTTRNTHLDNLARGYSLGSNALPDEIADVRLKFGRVDNERLAEQAAFGIEGTVTTLQKGDVVF